MKGVIWESLAHLDRLALSLPESQFMPTPAHRETLKALIGIAGSSNPAAAEPPRSHLESALREIHAAIKSTGNLSSVRPVFLRDATWLLWDGNSDLAQFPIIVDAILKNAEDRLSALRALVDVWFIRFRPEDASFAVIGQRIVAALENRRGTSLEAWLRGHERFALFDPERGPESLAEAVLGSPGPDLLVDLRFDDPLRATGGYMRSVMRATADRLGQHLSTPQRERALQSAKAFYAPNDSLRFDEPEPCGEMADAFVSPWLADAKPPDEMKLEVLRFLRSQLGDPRVQPDRWIKSTERTRQTVRSWLAQVSLDAFFKLIGRFAANDGHDHQWRERQAFWGACLRRGLIDDGWLVLGQNVERSVKGNTELRGSYGSLIGASPNHSVLIMRVGRLLFAEWSQNGSLRAWPIGHPSAPSIFERTSDASQLRRGAIRFPPPRNRPELGETSEPSLTHHSGTWQGRVAALLYIEGIQISAAEWRV